MNYCGQCRKVVNTEETIDCWEQSTQFVRVIVQCLICKAYLYQRLREKDDNQKKS